MLESFDEEEINETIQEALRSDFNDFKTKLNKVNNIHKDEREKKKIDKNLKVDHGLVSFEDFEKEKEIITVGDIHGDLQSLKKILKLDENSRFVFLGDYGDRGEKSVEILYMISKLKILYPKKIILLRGNHEFPPDLSVSPFDMPRFLKKKYGRDWNEGYKVLLNFYDSLYHTTIVKGKYVLLHGGVPSEAGSIKDLALAREKHPEKRFLEDILWSDPREIEGTNSSMRGAGKIFGKDVTQNFLELTDTEILIRGHEPCNGVKSFHDGLGITVFSRKGKPYNNSKAGALRLKKSTNAQNIIKNAFIF